MKMDHLLIQIHQMGQINITDYTDSSISGNFNATLEKVTGDEVININDASFTDLVVTTVSGNPEQF